MPARHKEVILIENIYKLFLNQAVFFYLYDVLEAPDGIEGIKLFRENAVDLIITDIIMFEKDGVVTIMEVRKDSPNVKIIAISGGANIGPEVYLQLADTVGADRALTKPIDRKELLHTIDELLQPNR